MRALRATKVRRVVSYADTNHGHEGVIYQATNWKFIGKEKFRQQVLVVGDNAISMRQVYQKSRITGTYVESALKLQQLKKEGKAKAVLTKAKNIYIYDIRR